MEMRGSVKERITHPAFIEARARINFDKEEMTNLLYDPQKVKFRREMQ